MPVEKKTVVRTMLIVEGMPLGRVGIGKRVKGSSFEDKWCLIGGKSERKKWRKREAIREVSEETGISERMLLEVDEPYHVGAHRRREGEVLWETIYYLMEFDVCLLPQVFKSFNRDEFSEVAFVDLEEMRDLDFAFPSDVEFLTWFFEEVGL
jgi:8-oxo-dGTP pyrophosphatase MutT (NUDIX family)